MPNGSNNSTGNLGDPNGNSELRAKVGEILPNLGCNILDQLLKKLEDIGVTTTAKEDWAEVQVEDLSPPLSIIQARRLIAGLSVGKKLQATTGSTSLFGNMTREEYDRKRLDLYLRVKKVQRNIHAFNVFSRHQEQLPHLFDIVWSNLKFTVPLGIASSFTLLEGNEERNRRYLAVFLIMSAVTAVALQLREGGEVDIEAKEMGGASFFQADHPASNNNSSCRNERSESSDVKNGTTNNISGTSV